MQDWLIRKLGGYTLKEYSEAVVHARETIAERLNAEVELLKIELADSQEKLSAIEKGRTPEKPIRLANVPWPRMKKELERKDASQKR